MRTAFCLLAGAAALRGNAATEYWGSVFVGTPPQQYKVLFDTGSGNLVLPGVSCKSTACQLHHRYNPKASKTAWVHDGEQDTTSVGAKTLEMFGLGGNSDVAVAFGSGAVSALMVTDQMCLAKDDACFKMDMLMSTDESTVFAALGADGVLGLGLPDLAVTGQYSLVEQISENAKLPKNMFSFALAEGGGGSMVTFGGYREDQMQGELTWAPAIENSGYWTVEMEAEAGDHKLKGTKAVIDTGSSVIAAPKSAFNLLKAAPCDQAPDLTFKVNGKRFVVPAKAYRPTCDTFLVAPLDEAATADTVDVLQDAWVIGDPFLRHYLSVFDVDSRRVGFAKAKRSAGLLSRAAGSSTIRKSDGLLSISLERTVRGH